MTTDLQTIHAVESSYAYRVEQARVALFHAQERLLALLTEQRASLDGTLSASTQRSRHASPYTLGPIDPSELLTMHAHLSSGEECLLLVPVRLPLWVLNHPSFREGYEMNYESKEEGGDEEWGTVSQMVNLIYSKLLGEGFEDLTSGELAPDFGIWEIGWLLRDFTRLADIDRMLALTGIAHLCFLISFLPPEQPASWPPTGLEVARRTHNDAVKAYRGLIRGYREQGKSFVEAQRLALTTSVL